MPRPSRRRYNALENRQRFLTEAGAERALEWMRVKERWRTSELCQWVIDHGLIEIREGYPIEAIAAVDRLHTQLLAANQIEAREQPGLVEFTWLENAP